uniref:Putative UDP-glucose 4-epimerase, CapD-like Polysaccharide biosynthesis protein n=1 Tax=Magnetococcus massalia (strain MO-1) TaxID=451514 RepID=A0A1S7LM66_MAGMO|nr:putative UDP-glucose 4-epimerase, CapD-like Polysaccharide biosynthesis protein [Candidatus Magnetococcus massalia]
MHAVWIQQLSAWATRQPRRLKQLILALLDLIALPLCFWLLLGLHEGRGFPQSFLSQLPMMGLILCFQFPIFIRTGLYRAVLRYTGDRFFIGTLQSTSLAYLLAIGTAHTLGWTQSHPPLFWVSLGFMLLAMLGGLRWLARQILLQRQRGHIGRAPVAIYGAGSAGIQLLRALEHSLELRVVGIIDDEQQLHGKRIHGETVHAPHQIEDLIERYSLQRILLAMPSVSAKRRQELLNFLSPFPVKIQEMPSLDDLALGVGQTGLLQEIRPSSLLGRDPIKPDPSLMARAIAGKAVMVTGAGGSIGSELCRQILQQQPSVLILVERSEFFLYDTERKLLAMAQKLEQQVEIKPILACVRDSDRMRQIIRAFHVETLFHAAAYKHVPIVEFNPIEGVQNNIFGTYHTAQVAVQEGVQNITLISTDKAVRPTNIMGATKRMAELVIQGMAAHYPQTHFSIVRFGNVLASSGSVIPLFQEQIRQGGPVTVTEKEITRYFMTIPEATQLVIQAGAMKESGVIYVLDMGKPIRIYDCARRLIELSGYQVKDAEHPQGDIEIIFTGLRPGEKLHEELFIGEDISPTPHPRIQRVREETLPWQELQTVLQELKQASDAFDQEAVRTLLTRSATGYRPAPDIMDHVWLKKADK